MRGRVLSLIHVAEAVGQATGILAAGLLSSTLSLTVLLNSQAGCYLTSGLIAIGSFAAENPPTTDAPPADHGRATRRTQAEDGAPL